jgi:hypothetical protein
MSNRKMCVKCVPHCFTDEQIMPRVATRENFIQACQNRPHFLVCIVTGDECWVLQYDHEAKYKGCLESIQPFWISREPVVWRWCNLATSQRRLYSASVKSLSHGDSQSAVRRSWVSSCTVWDHHIHNDQASRSASSQECAFPFYSSRAGFFGKASHHPGLLVPLQPRFGSLRLLAFPIAKIAVEMEEIFECDSHKV